MIAGTACRFAGERPWKRSGKCLILCANSIGLARLPIGHKALITVGVAMVGANTHRRPPRRTPASSLPRSQQPNHFTLLVQLEPAILASISRSHRTHDTSRA